MEGKKDSYSVPIPLLKAHLPVPELVHIVMAYRGALRDSTGHAHTFMIWTGNLLGTQRMWTMPPYETPLEEFVDALEANDPTRGEALKKKLEEDPRASDPLAVRVESTAGVPSADKRNTTHDVREWRKTADVHHGDLVVFENYCMPPHKGVTYYFLVVRRGALLVLQWCEHYNASTAADRGHPSYAILPVAQGTWMLQEAGANYYSECHELVRALPHVLIGHLHPSVGALQDAILDLFGRDFLEWESAHLMVLCGHTLNLHFRQWWSSTAPAPACIYSESGVCSLSADDVRRSTLATLVSRLMRTPLVACVMPRRFTRERWTVEFRFEKETAVDMQCTD